MKNTFETSLPVGLVLSLYDFHIPPGNQNEFETGESPFYSPCKNNLVPASDECVIYDHTWINGELSWKL